MKESGLTRQERFLVAWMKFWAVAFFVAAVAVAVAPDWLLAYITNIGIVFFNWNTRMPQFGQERFWLVPAASLLIVQSYLCLGIVLDPGRRLPQAKTVILAKFLCIVGFLICFFALEPLFIYAAGAAIDGLIFLILWFIYRAAVCSRPNLL